MAAPQPDISYHPNAEQYKARTARRLAENPSLANSTLPEGFPQKVESPLVWEGKDFKDEKEWVYELNPGQLVEIDDAVKHFRCEYAFTRTLLRPEYCYLKHLTNLSDTFRLRHFPCRNLAPCCAAYQRNFTMDEDSSFSAPFLLTIIPGKTT